MGCCFVFNFQRAHLISFPGRELIGHSFLVILNKTEGDTLVCTRRVVCSLINRI